MEEELLRKTMCEVGERLWNRGLIGATEGNLSVRLGPDRILCTPSGGSKGHLDPEQLVILDLDGLPVDSKGKPSSEIRLHLRLMRRRPDCQAVIHAHPLVATGLSVAEKDFPDNVLPEALYILGPVARVPFAMPGGEELPESLEPYLENHKTFLLGHHGAATLGLDLWDACFRMETLERTATMLLVAETFGGAKPLPADSFARMAAVALHGRLGS
jgi:L-fuculose-phosphate aldolase